LLEQIKIAANKRDVPYQSLIKMRLAEKVKQSSQSDVTASASCTSRDAG
jgi:predicted DNA binding CopG/RHH family protein